MTTESALHAAACSRQTQPKQQTQGQQLVFRAVGRARWLHADTFCQVLHTAPLSITVSNAQVYHQTSLHQFQAHCR